MTTFRSFSVCSMAVLLEKIRRLSRDIKRLRGLSNRHCNYYYFFNFGTKIHDKYPKYIYLLYFIRYSRYICWLDKIEHFYNEKSIFFSTCSNFILKLKPRTHFCTSYFHLLNDSFCCCDEKVKRKRPNFPKYAHHANKVK